MHLEGSGKETRSLAVRPADPRLGPDDRVAAVDHGLKSPERRSRLQLARQAVRSPLLLLWILTGVCFVGGIIEWVFFDGLPWEGLGSAGLIAGVIEIVARVKRVPAWPWQHDPSL